MSRAIKWLCWRANPMYARSGRCRLVRGGAGERRRGAGAALFAGTGYR
jgi:hypothetical protein